MDADQTRKNLDKIHYWWTWYRGNLPPELIQYLGRRGISKRDPKTTSEKYIVFIILQCRNLTYKLFGHNVKLGSVYYYYARCIITSK